MSTPYFYVEALLALLIPWRKIRLLMLSVMLLLCLSSEASIYFGFSNLFVGIFSFAINLKYISFWQNFYLLLVVLAVTSFLIFTYSCLKIVINKSLSNIIILMILPFVVVLYLTERKSYTGINLIGRIPFESLASENFESVKVVGKTNRYLSSNLGAIGNKNYYIFILESFGVFSDQNINKYFIDLIKEGARLDPTYKIESQYSSGTLGGELREMCGIKLSHLNVIDNIAEFEYCLPNILKLSGWRTTVVHPGPRGIYNRPNVYRDIGFENYYASEQFKDVDSCGGGWAGAPCDALIISYKLEKLIDPDRKNLLYYLSINSHHPYNNDNQEIQVCRSLGIQIGRECEYFSHLRSTFIAIVDFIKRNDGYYYIVGDHAPPGIDSRFVSKGLIPIYQVMH